MHGKFYFFFQEKKNKNKNEDIFKKKNRENEKNVGNELNEEVFHGWNTLMINSEAYFTNYQRKILRCFFK